MESGNLGIGEYNIALRIFGLTHYLTSKLFWDLDLKWEEERNEENKSIGFWVGPRVSSPFPTRASETTKNLTITYWKNTEYHNVDMRERCAILFTIPDA